MRERLSTAMEITGLVLVTVGLTLITPIAGIIFAGAALTLVGYALDGSTE